ncbi:hypothetical protein [Candidatus Enterovibrio escicola]|uniref:hypothetical protein n=1 Tax=Candidatus Enterovibrio escicola TaxID=1927127 RepID=UPI001237AB54|nr:hypothetical protein [Candidatus Enterovibrio escacola]
MKYTPARYKQVVSELKQANNTIKQLRQANEFKRTQIDRNKKGFMIVLTVTVSSLCWSLIALWSLI